MQRREFTSGVVAACVGVALPARAQGISESDAALGIRAALERGATSAVNLLGRTGGFLDNPKVRIPLPGWLEDAKKVLRMAGQQKRVDELVTAMNRAAEQAVPAGKTVLVNAVKSMSVEDGRRILTGGDNSVTRFFADKTRVPLGEQFLPIVTRATERVSLAAKYNNLAGKAAGFGLMKADDANIERYVTGKTLDGLYLMIGEEERKIRRDPVGTGSAILRQVFGAIR